VFSHISNWGWMYLDFWRTSHYFTHSLPKRRTTLAPR
jgi:hypothetical protein